MRHTGYVIENVRSLLQMPNGCVRHICRTVMSTSKWLMGTEELLDYALITRIRCVAGRPLIRFYTRRREDYFDGR
jgi:hypothetical protein